MTKFKSYNFNNLESTNLEAKSYPFNSVIIAKSQSKGKGRFKRTWSSPEGGIYLSIVIKPTTKIIQQYTFLAALATFKTLKKYNNNLKIKWPNDLIIKRKKICGILTQNIFYKNQKKMIIGIGINTNNNLPRSLKKTATTLKLQSKIKLNNGKITKELIKNFETQLINYEKKGFKNIAGNWLKNADLKNQNMLIKSINKTIKGKAIGINNNCNLLIKSNNKIHRISEGDVFYI